MLLPTRKYYQLTIVTLKKSELWPRWDASKNKNLTRSQIKNKYIQAKFEESRLDLLVYITNAVFVYTNDGILEIFWEPASCFGNSRHWLWFNEKIIVTISSRLEGNLMKFKKYCPETSEFHESTRSGCSTTTNILKVLNYSYVIFAEANLPIGILSEEATDTNISGNTV